jgi:hypothetical protein
LIFKAQNFTKNSHKFFFYNLFVRYMATTFMPIHANKMHEEGIAQISLMWFFLWNHLLWNGTSLLLQQRSSEIFWSDYKKETLSLCSNAYNIYELDSTSDFALTIASPFIRKDNRIWFPSSTKCIIYLCVQFWNESGPTGNGCCTGLINIKWNTSGAQQLK